MAWERGYYYRVRKVKGRVVREYVGCGLVAALVAELDDQERTARETMKALWRSKKTLFERLDADVRSLIEITDCLTRAALLVAGYRQHRRGEWRKRRNGGREDMLKPTLTTAPLPTPKTGAEVRTLVRRAQDGDKATLPALRALLQNRAVIELLGGDLARRTVRCRIEKAAGTDLAFREALLRQLDVLRDGLAGSAPTPIEELLVERILLCWLDLHLLEFQLAVQMERLSLTHEEFSDRCRDRAQRRYLSALKALATVRRLALPVLQVNIAKQQLINAAIPGSTERPGQKSDPALPP
jgi:hypothetical protein